MNITNPFSIDLEEFLKQSNAIENVHNEDALRDAGESWEYLSDQNYISHEIIQKAHKRLLNNRQPDIAGEYRSVMVRIGGDIPPRPEEITTLMSDQLDDQPEDAVDAIRWHVNFEYIHPFEDGNGRIGRLIYLWHCHQLEIDPIVWRANNVSGYYDLF